jgi:hypothetical protein
MMDFLRVFMISLPILLATSIPLIHGFMHPPRSADVLLRSRMARRPQYVTESSALPRQHVHEKLGGEDRRQFLEDIIKWQGAIVIGAYTLSTEPLQAIASGTPLPDISESLPKEIKYEVVKLPNALFGTPSKPQRGQTIKVLYTMSLNGFEGDQGKDVQTIDSTRSFLGDPGLELFAGVGQTIKGGDLLLMDMLEGEHRRAIIPPEFAFGSEGVKNSVPENATIYFDVTLVRLKNMAPIDENSLREWLETHPI